MAGTIIASGKASYYELKTALNLEDMFNIFEVIVVNAYNEQMAVEEAQKRKER